DDAPSARPRCAVGAAATDSGNRAAGAGSWKRPAGAPVGGGGVGGGGMGGGRWPDGSALLRTTWSAGSAAASPSRIVRRLVRPRAGPAGDRDPVRRRQRGVRRTGEAVGRAGATFADAPSAAAGNDGFDARAHAAAQPSAAGDCS